MTKLTERVNLHGNKKQKEETTMNKVSHNRTTSRIVSFLLAVMIMIMPLAGCMNNQQKDEFMDAVNQTTSASTTQKAETPNTGSIAGEKDSTEADTELQKQLDEANAENEALRKELEEYKAEALKKAEAEKAAKKEWPFSEIEYNEEGYPIKVSSAEAAVELALRSAALFLDFENAAYLIAPGEELCINEDVCSATKEYEDNLFDFAHRDGVFVGVTTSARMRYVGTGYVNGGGKLYSYSWDGRSCDATEGFPIQKDTKKDSRTYGDMVMNLDRAFRYSKGEKHLADGFLYSFDFVEGVYEKEEKPSSGTTQKPSNPQPSNPTHTCPTPEKETVTKLVCKVCGMEDCPGHCGKCHATIPYCSCKPDTLIVVKCPICGLEGCSGHKETVYVPVPGDTIEVCNKCKNPIEDCTCKNDSNPGCNHQHGCTCGNCGNCQPKPGCDHQHGCTCGNCGNCQPKPEHNQRPPAHNDQVFDSDESKNDTGVKDENKDHSQKPNDGNQGNNETGKPSDDGQDEIPDLTLNPEEPRNDILSRKNSSESTADKNLSVEIVSTENTSGENIQQENQQQISKSPSTALHSDRPLD